MVHSNNYIVFKVYCYIFLMTGFCFNCLRFYNKQDHRSYMTLMHMRIIKCLFHFLLELIWSYNMVIMAIWDLWKHWPLLCDTVFAEYLYKVLIIYKIRIYVHPHNSYFIYNQQLFLFFFTLCSVFSTVKSQWEMNLFKYQQNRLWPKLNPLPSWPIAHHYINYALESLICLYVFVSCVVIWTH